jgi:hypothetical protein
MSSTNPSIRKTVTRPDLTPKPQTKADPVPVSSLSKHFASKGS